MNALVEESWSIWRAGGALMVPLSLLAFGLFFAEIRLHLRIRRHRAEQAGGQMPPRPGLSAPDQFAIRRNRVLQPIDRRIRHYAVLVGVCPLMGLLGTVAGMTSTFEGIARPGAGNLSQDVAGGISEALVTTQAGLLVAIPGMILLAVLRRGRDRIALDFFTAEGRALEGETPATR